jgi:hypothetical protein
MDIGAVEAKGGGKKGKGKGHGKTNGKGKDGKGKDTKDKEKDLCFYCHKPGHRKSECRKRIADEKASKGVNNVDVSATAAGAASAAAAVAARPAPAAQVGAMMVDSSRKSVQPMWVLGGLEALQHRPESSTRSSTMAPASMLSAPTRMLDQEMLVHSVMDDNLVMVDSGAARSVCPPNHAAEAGTTACSESVRLVAADGASIPCRGERFVTYMQGDKSTGVHYKVADVKKPVLGVSQAIDRGASFVFSSDGCFMIQRSIRIDEPDQVPLMRRDDLFYLQTDGVANSSADALIMPLHRDEPAVEAEAAREEDLHRIGGDCSAATAVSSEPAAIIEPEADAETCERASGRAVG